MHFTEVEDKELLHTLVIQYLRNIGIKQASKLKKYNVKYQEKSPSISRKLFRKPLHLLKCEDVELTSGAVVNVPYFVADACKYIESQITTEGLFRKAGSTARQREIQRNLDEGRRLGAKHHVIDVANILKLFLRELPEPLIPYAFHDVLVRCLKVKEKGLDAILSACILIPVLHLDTLAYFMQFLRKVADHSDENKMDMSNLAIITTPTIMPATERKCDRAVSLNESKLQHHTQVVEILIENAAKIGVLTENIYKKLPMVETCPVIVINDMENIVSNDELRKSKKKKRRSGSLTRVFHGLKRIVRKGSTEGMLDEDPGDKLDGYLTPCIKPGTKRKAPYTETGLSSKKKCEILQTLPQNSVLSKTPYTPHDSRWLSVEKSQGSNQTPSVCSNPSPTSHYMLRSSSKICLMRNKLCTPEVAERSTPEKRRQFSEDRDFDISAKKGMQTATQVTEPRETRSQMLSSAASVERRWSSASAIRDKKRVTCETPKISSSVHGMNLEGNLSNIDMLRSPYIVHNFMQESVVDLSEDENMFSILFSDNQGTHKEEVCSESELIEKFSRISTGSFDSQSSVHFVQAAYEKTLQESGQIIDTSADQLARTLGKQLKIRRSAEGKVIRSPSARKIGTIRRRSKENAQSSQSKFCPEEKRGGNIVTRSQSCILQPQFYYTDGFSNRSYVRATLRRGRPNTVFTGLPQPSPLRVLQNDGEDDARIVLSFLQDASELKNNEKLTKAYSLDEEILCRQEDTTFRVGSSNNSTFWSTMSRESSQHSYNSNTEPEIRRRASSFHGIENCGSCNLRKTTSANDVKVLKNGSISSQGNENTQTGGLGDTESSNVNDCWRNAQTYLQDELQQVPTTGRASITKLRSQNAGRVLASVKLFDKMRINGVKMQQDSLVQNNVSSSSMKINSNSCCVPSQKSDRNISKSPLCKNRCKQLSENSPKKIGSPRRNAEHKDAVKGKKKKSPLLKDPRAFVQDKIPSAQISSRMEEKENASKNFSIGKQDESTGETRKHVSYSPTMVLPDGLKEIIYDVCTPLSDKIRKTSISPLKECNRNIEAVKILQSPEKMTKIGRVISPISNRQNSSFVRHKTPHRTPVIKKSLRTLDTPGRTPRSLMRSAENIRRQTPMKAFHVGNTPCVPQRRRSPRVLL